MADKIDKIKIIFFGTPEFGKIVLEKLIKQSNFEIIALVCAPDKPVGRKQIFAFPPTKILAQKNHIFVLQPERLDDDFREALKEFGAELFVVAAYGKIIPKNILEIPRFGSLNVHPSLLSKYRGASPIQTALLNGDHETGVTIMLMDEKMDHGPIISNSQFLISNNDTYDSLSKKLAEGGAELLVKTIPDFIAGKIKPVPQDENQATYCKIIKKEDGMIDWHKSAKQIYNQWRAFYPWPGIFSQLTVNPVKSSLRSDNGASNKQLTIKFIEVAPSLVTQVFRPDIKPGEFLILDPDFRRGDKKGKELGITCGQNSVLQVKKLQPEGKRIMSAEEFINGYLKI